MKKLLVLILALSILVGCTDATQAQWQAIGSEGSISCYSGGVVIYSGISSGKIRTEEGSDGWYFNDKATNRLVRVSGDCVIKN